MMFNDVPFSEHWILFNSYYTTVIIWQDVWCQELEILYHHMWCSFFLVWLKVVLCFFLEGSDAHAAFQRSHHAWPTVSTFMVRGRSRSWISWHEAAKQGNLNWRVGPAQDALRLSRAGSIKWRPTAATDLDPPRPTPTPDPAKRRQYSPRPSSSSPFRKP